MEFILFIDADSLPQSHRRILLRRIVKNNIRAVFAADRKLSDVEETIAEHTAALRYPLRETLEKSELRKVKSTISMVVVTTGANAADDYIAENIKEGDLCITHDIPLAARAVEKGAIALDDRGNILDESNMAERLSIRNAMYILREGGAMPEKQKRMDQKNLEEFANALDRILSKYGL